MYKFLQISSIFFAVMFGTFLNVQAQCNGVSGGVGNGNTIGTLPTCNTTTASVNVPRTGYAVLSGLEIGGKYTVNITNGNYITVRTAVSGGTVTASCTSCTSLTFFATQTTHYVVVNQDGCPGTWSTSSATLNYKRENPVASTINVTYNCTNTVLGSSGGEGAYQWQASNGTNVSGATSSSYTITSSTTPQYSAYRLRRAAGTCYSYSSNLNVVPRANFNGNVTVASNVILAGTYNFNGDFTLNSGVTVTVPAGCELNISANNINIAGTINATGTGNAASSGGGGGTGYGGLGCDVNSNAYTAAGVRASSNGSGTGGGKAASSNGSNGVGCGQDCGNGDDYAGAVRGAGGAGGGGGGAYGGAGSAAGSGGTAGWYSGYATWNNSYCGTPFGGGGGSGGGAAGTTYGAATDEVIDFGSGGAGGGGGGRGASNGTTGGSGGRGGGKVTLISKNNPSAPYTFTLSGNIYANGANGANGGNGGNGGRSASNCCGDACDQANVEEATTVSGAGGGGGAGGGSGGGVMLMIYGNSNLTGIIQTNGGNGGNGGSGGGSISGSYGGNLFCDASNVTGDAGVTGNAGGRGGGGRVKIFTNPCHNHTGTPSLQANAATAGNGTASNGTIHRGNISAYSTPVAGTISTNQSICYNTKPAAFTGTASTGGTGAYTYNWFSCAGGTCPAPATGNSSPGVGWTDRGTNTIGFTESNNLTQTTTYVRRTTTGSCVYWSNIITVSVTPNAAVSSVTAGTTPQCIGSTTTYTANGVVLGGGTGSWSSSNGLIATVNASTGLVTAVAAGTVTITYTVTGGCGGTQSKSASYTVTPTASAGTVTAGTSPQCIGATTTYTVSGVVLGGGTGAWSSSNGTVATVNASTGVVTAAGAGTCNIVYTVTGGCGGTKTASKPYTVTPNAAVSSVTAGTTPQCIGSTTTYTANGVVLGGGTGAWSSSNGLIATVNASTGLVTAVAAGTVTITYTVTGGCGGTQSKSASYTVTPTASAGTVTAGTSPQCIGATTTYTVSGVVLGGGTGAWSSSNGTVATVNPSTGVVTAAGAGTCNIVYTVTGGCGGTKTASKPYTVSPTTVPGSISGGTTPLCLGGNTGAITLSGNTGSVVKWQKQLNNGGWSDIANTSTSYSEVPSLAGTWDYRAVVQSGACASANTNAVTITVNAAPAITITVPGNDSTGCNNEIFTLNTSISGGGGGSISYQWAIFDYGSNSYTDSTGATASSLGTKPLTNSSTSLDKLYKFKVTYNRTGSGCSAASDDIEITIFPTPSLTSTMEDCASTVVDNGNDKWDYIYTNGSASTPGFMVSDSSGGAELVYPANNGVQNFKIYRVPMGSGSHDFKIVDDNGCIAVSTLNKNSALPTTVPTTLPSTNNGQCYVKGFNEWVHIRKQGSSNEAMVSVQDNGVDLGLVTATSYLESTTPSVNNMGVTCNGTPQAAMRRHFVVKSSNYPDPSTKFQDNNANPTNVNLRLYFTQADFADLSSASTANNVIGNQCTEDDDITDKQDLYLTKYSDYGQLGNEDGDYMNNTFTSAYFKVFNVGNLTNPLTIQDNGFDTEFGTNSSNIHYAELSVSEFSEFWLHGSTSGAPLPVEMLYIEAKNINNEYIKINWATATELNNRMFEVERSTDGTSFSKIGTVMGNGTSTERHDYSYNDKTAAVGIRYYYRLKQIDFDEAYEYSPVVSEMLKGDEMFKVSEFVPNPAADNAKIFITTGKEQGIQIEMHNYIGEVVKHGAMYLNKGNNTVSFDFADLAAGTYTTRIVSGTNTYIRRVVITR